MKIRMAIGMAIIAFALLSVVWVVIVEANKVGDTVLISKDGNGYVWRKIDGEMGIVCYTYRDGFAGGISCVQVLRDADDSCSS